MKLLSKAEQRFERNDNGIITPLPSRWLVRCLDRFNSERVIEFDHDPTDDEVLDAIDAAPRPLVPTRNIERLLDAVQERATEWYVVKALIDDIEVKGEATGPQITKARASAEHVLRQRARDALVRLIQAVA